MVLTDAQYGALHQIVEHGPISAEEILGPQNMAGARKIKFVCNSVTAATMQKLLALDLISVERVAKERPVNAVGKQGHRRNAVTINITEAGRAAVSE